MGSVIIAASIGVSLARQFAPSIGITSSSSVCSAWRLSPSPSSASASVLLIFVVVQRLSFSLISGCGDGGGGRALPCGRGPCYHVFGPRPPRLHWVGLLSAVALGGRGPPWPRCGFSAVAYSLMRVTWLITRHRASSIGVTLHSVSFSLGSSGIRLRPSSVVLASSSGLGAGGGGRVSPCGREPCYHVFGSRPPRLHWGGLRPRWRWGALAPHGRGGGFSRRLFHALLFLNWFYGDSG